MKTNCIWNFQTLGSNVIFQSLFFFLSHQFVIIDRDQHIKIPNDDDNELHPFCKNLRSKFQMMKRLNSFGKNICPLRSSPRTISILQKPTLKPKNIHASCSSTFIFTMKKNVKHPSHRTLQPNFFCEIGVRE